MSHRAHTHLHAESRAAHEAGQAGVISRCEHHLHLATNAPRSNRPDTAASDPQQHKDAVKTDSGKPAAAAPTTSTVGSEGNGEASTVEKEQQKQQGNGAQAEAQVDILPEDPGGLMAAKINAVAGKINAARELARRLAEEKNAAAKPEASGRGIYQSSAAEKQ